MEQKEKRDKKLSSRSFCFGKSFTFRLPRSKSRDKSRMVQSKSLDCLNRKRVSLSNENPEFVKTTEKLRLDPEFFENSEKLRLDDRYMPSRYDPDHLDIYYSSRGQDERVTRELLASSSQTIEPNIPFKSHCVLRNRSKERTKKVQSDKKTNDFSRAGSCAQHCGKDFESSKCGEKLVSDFKVLGDLHDNRRVPTAPSLDLNDDEVYTSRKEWLTMARAHRSSLKEKLQEEFLSCKICLEPFLRPKALPCLHSFCEHCLKDYVRRHPGIRPGHFPCPMCRKDIRIPDGGIEHFQDNFLLLSLSDTLEEDDVWQFPGQQLSPPRCIAPPSPLEQKLRDYEWYFGKVSRNASEEWLLATGYPKGSFLIRQGEASPDTYTLSVRDCDELRGYLVKHYKILAKRSDHPLKDYYYITPKRTFRSLQDLVDHYSENADGLCCKLTQVCGKPRSLAWALERGKEDEFSVPRESLNLIRRIGGGQFADVWLGKWNQRDIAIKMQRTDTVKMAAFLDEAQILKTLDHPNIVNLLAVCSSSEPVYLVTEYLENGRLSLYLREGEGKELKLTQLIWLGAQIADGLAYMEKEKFIHRNLGARNILVGQKNKVKIAGFGMTKCADDPDFNFRRGLKMAIKWMSPEVLLYNKYSTKADVWSFGILLTEIFTYGKEPYEGMGSKEAFENVQNGYRMPQPDLCPTEIFDVILTCWSTNPPSRPSFDFLNTFLHDWQSPAS